MARYTFGDDRPAVERLGLVAQAYAPVSRAFLAEHGPRGASLALDLGCGPGFSTALVADVLAPRRLVGLDASPDFLDVARARVPSAEFDVLDVTSDSMPRDPDIVFARLVLAHVAEPTVVAQRWQSQLGPGGVVLIEDLDDIDAPDGPLRDYDDLSAAIVRDGGGVMYAGRLLEPLGGTCTRVTVPAALAARIYLYNVRRWRQAPPVGVPPAQLEDLEARLATVADDSAPVSWIVRQLVLRA